MKIVGFYLFKGTVVSPTVFRAKVLEEVREIKKLGEIKEPGVKDRHDIIEFMQVNEEVLNGYLQSK